MNKVLLMVLFAVAASSGTTALAASAPAGVSPPGFDEAKDRVAAQCGGLEKDALEACRQSVERISEAPNADDPDAPAKAGDGPPDGPVHAARTAPAGGSAPTGRVPSTGS